MAYVSEADVKSYNSFSVLFCLPPMQCSRSICSATKHRFILLGGRVKHKKMRQVGGVCSGHFCPLQQSADPQNCFNCSAKANF